MKQLLSTLLFLVHTIFVFAQNSEIQIQISEAVAADRPHKERQYLETFFAKQNAEKEEARKTTLQLTTRQINQVLQSKKTQNANLNFFAMPVNPMNSWVNLGPTDIPPTNTGLVSRPGVGRIDCFAFEPTGTGIWAGAPTGGLWHTTAPVNTWTCMNDDWSVIGISSIAIDPTNAQIIYASIGDRDASWISNGGIVKTTDGGTTWNPSGANNLSSEDVFKILINPDNPSTIIVATDSGLYKSEDSGNNWTLVWTPATTGTQKYMDAVYKLGDTTTVFICYEGEIHKSTDGGDTFSALSLPYTASDVIRTRLAVSLDETDALFILTAKKSNSGLNALYKSADGGTTWNTLLDINTTVANSPWNTADLFGYQMWYNNAIAVSPTDSDFIFAGGTHCAYSTDGGTTWTYDPNDGLHVDFHDFMFHPTSNELYASNDGGIYKRSTGGVWTAISQGLSINQTRGFASSSDGTNIMFGSQDNGLQVKEGSNWYSVLVGDGGHGLSNPLDACSFYYPSPFQLTDLRKFTNCGVNNTVSFNAPFRAIAINPNNSSHLVLLKTVGKQAWQTTDGGANWNLLYDFASISQLGYPINKIVISKDDPNYIYVSSIGELFKSIDGGTTWTQHTYPSGILIARLEGHPDDKNHLFAVINFEIYESLDAGTTWNKLTGSPTDVRSIAVIGGPNNGIYAGTFSGVYYKDDALSNWVLHGTGLPNLEVMRVELLPDIQKIRVATYGRGIWEADMYPTVVPVELLYFQGRHENSSNLLEWATASQANHDYFLLEHSTNGRDFSALEYLYGDAFSFENEVYEFEDINPFSGLTYYRLTQVDLDGNITRYPVISVMNELKTNLSLLSENPTKNHLKLKIDVNESLDYFIQIYDVRGHMVLQKEGTAYDKKVIEKFNLNNLESGSYFLILTNENGQMLGSLKFLKGE